jgi:hypothetical protein
MSSEVANSDRRGGLRRILRSYRSYCGSRPSFKDSCFFETIRASDRNQIVNNHSSPRPLASRTTGLFLDGPRRREAALGHVLVRAYAAVRQVI